MPDDTDEFKVKVSVEGLDKIGEQIAAQVQKAIAMIRTPGMQVTGLVGGAEGKGKDEALTRLGAVVSHLTTVVGGLANASLSGAVQGLAGGEGIMREGGPMMGVLGLIAGILEGLAPIKAIMSVIQAILSLIFMPLAMVLMAILMPFLMPILMLLGKLPWAAIFAAIMLIEKGITWGLNEIAAGITWFVGWLPGAIGAVISFFQGVAGDVMGILSTIWGDLQVAAGAIVSAWNWLTGVAGAVFNDIRTAIMGVWDFMGQIYTVWSGIFADVFNDIRAALLGAWGVLTTLWNWFDTVIGDIWKGIGDGINMIRTILNDIAGALKAVGNAVNPSNWGSELAGMFQTGGIVPKTGLALVHAGEMIIPSGGGAPSINVTVTGNTISSAMDLNNIANQVAQQIANNARRLRTW
jgi:hypothetical protein